MAESEDGLDFRLKTEQVGEGRPYDNFSRQNHRTSFSEENNNLLYLPREIRVKPADLYDLVFWFIGEIKRKEIDYHHRMLAGGAALSIKHILRRGEMRLSFPRVYAVCRNYFEGLPSYEELGSENLKQVMERLETEEWKFTSGHNLRISGVDFFKRFQWEEKGTRTFAFDPRDIYNTGCPKSMQFREDLERYAKLAQRQE